MRGYLVSFLFAVAVLCVVWIVCSLAARDVGLATAGTAPPVTAGADTWRRTVNGWERMSDWPVVTIDADPGETALGVHPLVIGSLELLLSLAALVAWPYPGP